MNHRQFILLAITLIILSATLCGQDYAEQYLKCAERLKGFELSDSTYMVRLWQKDSCLTGVQAPNFKVLDINNNPIELSKFKGQIVFLNFWGTKCGPCVDEIPKLNELVRHYKGKMIKFISLASDQKKELKKFLKKIPFNFDNVPDAAKIGSEVFKLTDVSPYSIIIDASGKIYSMAFGSLGDITFSYYKEILDKCISPKF